ncbi:recombinase, partial [Candidatus Pacearchaeota archaeon]|nr:recombinase [Candidatus Pacearchaeota archaeon]
MSLTELQEFTRISKYARYNKDKKRRENWKEQVVRKFDMHRAKYAEILPTIIEPLKFAESMMLSKHVLGSQRALQYGGQPILDKNSKLYNCCSTYVDRVRMLQEAMWLSLCGCGCGFSVQKHHVAKLPKVSPAVGPEITYEIEDSIEGWADSLGVLLSTYFTKDQPFSEYYGKRVRFIYNKIRRKGSLIKSSGAKAPGPAPLREAHQYIQKLLDMVASKQDKLEPIHVYDILMYSADAVISGGIRRSANICLFSPDDEKMKNAKRGNWLDTNPQRQNSNNSVVLLRETTKAETFQDYIKIIKEYGEPGFIFVDDLECLFNPCAEVGMYAYDSRGRSGWSFCNLSEINIKQSKTPEVFLQQCEAAAIIGTIQAGYTDFSYLGPISEEIVRREALIGVSMTGMGDNPELAFDPELQRKGARLVKKVNVEIAAKIGINPAARCTVVKPSGTASCLLGTSSGIHPHHARRYIRRAVMSNNEETLKFFKKYNPRACEISTYKPKLQEVVSFICEVPRNARTKNQTSALELLEMVKITQQNWINEGKTDSLCVKPWLQHNVSNTIHILDHEWDDVVDYIYKYKKY